MSECQHKWEDAQLRTTKDGMYILSVDYCAKCGAHDLSISLLMAQAEVQRLKAELRSTQQAIGFVIEKGSDAAQVAIENIHLEAEVERLKAYKALADEIERRLIDVGNGCVGYEWSLIWLARYDALTKETTT